MLKPKLVEYQIDAIVAFFETVQSRPGSLRSELRVMVAPINVLVLSL